MIYLDNNATTKPSPGVVEAMRRGLEDFWHNPSSIHRPGQAARQQIELARKSVAALLGAQTREVVFTSSGTEALDLAIRGVLAGWPAERGVPRFITTRVEHSALRSLGEELRECGKAEVVYAPLVQDRSGRVDVGALASLVNERTALVSVQWANNETGVVQPVREIAEICRARGAIFHTDATQWVGKLPCNVMGEGSERAHAPGNSAIDTPAAWCDVLTCSPHKFYGPKGVGIAWIRRGLRLKPCVRGSQELGRRGGTENVPGILGAGAAAQEATAWLADPANVQRGRALRDRFERGVLEAAPGAVVNAPADPGLRVWNTSNIGFPRLEAEALLLMLSERGVCASAGAACSSGSLEASPVLTAMGVPHEIAFGSLRFSLAKDSTSEEIDEAIGIVGRTVEKLRKSTMAVV